MQTDQLKKQRSSSEPTYRRLAGLTLELLHNVADSVMIFIYMCGFLSDSFILVYFIIEPLYRNGLLYLVSIPLYFKPLPSTWGIDAFG